MRVFPAVFWGLMALLSGPQFLPSVAAAPKFESAILRADGLIEFRLSGATNKAHRIEISTDLRSWTKFSVLNQAEAVKVFTDQPRPGQVFYRAIEEEAVVASGFFVASIQPSAAMPGDELRLLGNFAASPGDKDRFVRFGSVVAEAKEILPSEWRVIVPEGAETGPLRVETGQTNAVSKQVLTVLGQVQIKLVPPPGKNAADFTVVNTYGGATDQGGSTRLRVRQDAATINVAADVTTNRFLFAVSVGAGQLVELGTQSTAETLVFLSPLLASSDSMVASRTLAVIRTDSQVAELGRLLGSLFSQPADVFTNATVMAQYAAAVKSVATSPALASLASELQASRSRATLHSTQRSSGDYPLDLEYVEITRQNEESKEWLGPYARYVKPGVGPRFPQINPVDWFVTVREVDSSAAFPDGKLDFDKAWRGKLRFELFPLKPESEFKEETKVEANLITEKMNRIKYTTKEFLEYLQNKIVAGDESIKFPERPGIYLLRAIGPGVTDADEVGFTLEQFKEARLRALALNLVSVVMDSISLMIDLGQLKIDGDKEELAVKTLLEVYKAAPGISKPSDLGPIAAKLTYFVLQELADKLVETGGEAVAEHLAKKGFEKLSQTVSGIGIALSAADKIGGAGQIVQRGWGFFATTPMETAFIVIGDPFKLDAVTVKPDLAAPGAEVEVRIQSTHLRRMFAPGTKGDEVSFEGPEVFYGKVIAVAGTVADQTLRIRLPATLGTRADGNYPVIVTTQGRRGEGTLRILTKPSIDSVTPEAGFAAVDSFDGQPFLGSALRVKGVLFSMTDRFEIAGPDGEVEVTDKSLTSLSSSTIQIRIPKGAQTGPLRIHYTSPTGEKLVLEGPRIEVWTNPVVSELAPTQGPPGTVVRMRLAGVGTDPNLIRVKFLGADLISVSQGLDRRVQTIVPNAAVSGEMRILTPGGATGAPFVVEPALVNTNIEGGTIQVGGISPITLGQAMNYANGDDFPADDDDDVKNPPTWPGDFVTDNGVNSTNRFPIGRGRKDVIRIDGVIGGDFTFNGSSDTYSGGTLTGSVTVTGENLQFTGVTLRGPVLVSGASNILRSNLEGTVRVTGRGNVIGGIITGQLILEGDENVIDLATFRNTPSHALIVKGRYNRIRGNFDTNSGDAIRVEGAQHNYIEVNRSLGNAGNGVTLTGGASFNEVRLSSGNTSGRNRPLYGSGNQGHGVALVGDAHDNELWTLSAGMSGNGLDGVNLDGPGVVRNRLGFGKSFTAHYNGRNGVTITNGAMNNSVGIVDLDGTSSSVQINFNRGSGLALFGARFTSAALTANSNGLHGVLVSGVKDPPSGTVIMTYTSSFEAGNLGAGLRLENGTTGVRAAFGLTLRKNAVGLELDGEDVSGNILEGRISESLGHGVVLRGARRNDLWLYIEKSGGDGIRLEGARDNLIRSSDFVDNGGAGLRLVGAIGNRFVSKAGNPFKARLLKNRWGMVLEQASAHNSFDYFEVNTSREHGIVVDGPGTSGNTFQFLSLSNSGMDGLRVQNQASDLNFGASEGAADGVIFGRMMYLSGNSNAAVRVLGNGTREIRITGAYVGSTSSAQATQAAGVVIEDQASDVTLAHNTFFQNSSGVVIRDGARRTVVVRCVFQSNLADGLVIENTVGTVIGGFDASLANIFYGNPNALRLSGAMATANLIANNQLHDNTAAIVLEVGTFGNRVGPDNLLEKNTAGIVLDQSSSNSINSNIIRQNLGPGIRLAGAAADNLITDNQIVGNPSGIVASGAATLRNSILNNSITGNRGQGIVLDQGAHAGLAAPVIDEIQGSAVLGAANAPDGSRIQVFTDPSVEGETLFASAQVIGGRFRAPFEGQAWRIGLLFSVNATVTDLAGNTSAFGPLVESSEAAVQGLAFTSTRDGNSEIHFVSREFPAAANLSAHAAADHSPALPLVSGCGDILFVSDRAGNSDIFKSKAAPGSSASALTAHSAADYDPRWLIDCSKVIFVSDRDGNPEIYSMNADGSTVTRLTTNPGIDRHPVPAREGARIVFETHRSGRSALWIMDATGLNSALLFDFPGNASQPAVSPDGTRIAFVADRDGNPEIYVAAMDGRQVVRLTNHSGVDSSPAWTLDGSAIVYASQRDGGNRLFQIAADGGSPQLITVGGGENTQPSLGRQ